MTTQNNFTTVAPYTGLASVIVEIISPAVNFIVAGLISAFTFLVNINKRPKRTPLTVPAPHVAMVMVPGNFVTGPFTHR